MVELAKEPRSRSDCFYSCSRSKNTNGCSVLTGLCDPPVCWRYETAVQHDRRMEEFSRKEQERNAEQDKHR